MKSKLICQPISKVLTRSEIRRVILVNRKARSHAIKTRRKTPVIDWMALNLHLWGLRLSECIHLKCGQIHRDYIALQKTKGNKPRDVVISPRFYRMILEHLTWKQSLGESVGDDDYLFYSHKRNGHYSQQGFAKMFKRAIARAGIDKPLTSHCGRHTLASHNSLVFSQPQLGHADVRTTQIYTHVLDSLKEAQKYGKILYSVLEE